MMLCEEMPLKTVSFIHIEPLIYEPSQHAHEQIIRTWVKKQILQREGKVNG